MTDKIITMRRGTLEEFASMAELTVLPANSFTTHPENDRNSNKILLTNINP